ncbi:hypothetical protein Taro_036610 [Colocasia esculenta]|uniref:START domain-containing protein n=1 Tax=Colocasia esculenta TaxID=4460 RepID=A0A843WGT0_COLES|nr:hypothetical protein [Colocasia esculenta]
MVLRVAPPEEGRRHQKVVSSGEKESRKKVENKSELAATTRKKQRLEGKNDGKLMSFGGFLDSGSAGARVVVDIPYSAATMPAAAMSQPRLAAASLAKPVYSSTGLSLALQTNLEGGEGAGAGGGQDEMMRRIAEMGDFDVGVGGRGVAGKANGHHHKEDDYESRSGKAADGIKQEAVLGEPAGQVLVPEQAYPDEGQTQLERHENALLRQENEKLKMENMAIREAMRNPMCQSCGGPAALGEVSIEQQHLRMENSRLRDELDRVTALAGRFAGRPMSALLGQLPSPMPDSSLELAVGGNGFGGLCHVPPTLPPASGLIPVVSAALSAVETPAIRPAPPAAGGEMDRSLERSMLAELALVAMEELMKKAQAEEPLWVRNGVGRDVLDEDEYLRSFSQCLGSKPVGFVTEATRETGMVIINSSALVETLMDADRWPDMFPSLIVKTSTTDVICTGMGGTRNGTLQLMRAELQVLSPLVPVREVSFLRFCKEHAQGVWAVVDVSVDAVRGNPSAAVSCRRLPSGCMVQDMPNGYSKVLLSPTPLIDPRLPMSTSICSFTNVFEQENSILAP